MVDGILVDGEDGLLESFVSVSRLFPPGLLALVLLTPAGTKCPSMIASLGVYRGAPVTKGG